MVTLSMPSRYTHSFSRVSLMLCSVPVSLEGCNDSLPSSIWKEASSLQLLAFNITLDFH